MCGHTFGEEDKVVSDAAERNKSRVRQRTYSITDDNIEDLAEEATILPQGEAAGAVSAKQAFEEPVAP
ncbi:hypothetical protein BVY02_02500, partial [bacterium J17]